jgi:hypothetical protein
MIQLNLMANKIGFEIKWIVFKIKISNLSPSLVVYDTLLEVHFTS